MDFQIRPIANRVRSPVVLALLVLPLGAYAQVQQVQQIQQIQQIQLERIIVTATKRV